MVDLPVAGLPPLAALGEVSAVRKFTYNEGNAATGGIWLITGAASSAVLKIARSPTLGPAGAPGWPTSDDPAHWNYWQREALAYRTGLAASYSSFGIDPPALLDSATLPDGSIALWLAHDPGLPGISWTPSLLGDFAHRLGAAQAAWIGRIPDHPWLSRRWLDQYLNRPEILVRWDVDWSHPLAAIWPAPVRSSLAALWPARDKALAAARAATPLTLAHLDVWPMNLVGSKLLDWSFVGHGGVGEDAANLIIDSVTDGLMPAALLPDIEAFVMDSYVEGIGSAVPADAVRRAIKLYGAAKYSWFGPAVVGRAVHEGVLGHGQYGVAGSVEEHLERHVTLVKLIADWSTAM
jgi:hypothetical protein